ncbi:MAG: FIG00454046: hypothetical protein [uncultured Paraburkholderia sp.]|nr:MAG: FIG00454046: hypothetical protein [uncultured Paraburkholderia sp.]CAH2775962.1 MAG: FIG00454046: hypothetical protein [uncultured Paraburkholderia sp.]CAH2909341.1 MAG: FIG00454046: hypothetical protein [uncultured Paraburkholderia sp.]CAH2910517.1 MAG: FIG00454046: hypothetical protein [uncultured Paraburkholderia sp.]
MDEELVSVVMGLAVLVIGIIFAVGHYRREYRRTQLLRQPDQTPVWHWQRHQHRN